MIRGLFRLIFQLITLLIVVLALTAAYEVFDGLNDKGDTADCAVVLGAGVKGDGQPGPILRERLERAVDLYHDHKVPLLIVSGANHDDGRDESNGMAHYLTSHGVPAVDIVQDHGGRNTDSTAQAVASIMRQRDLHSVMVVSHYYHITRVKLALWHAGVRNISQAHVGSVHKEDGFAILRDDVAIYYYLFKYYVQPAADKAGAQAKIDAEELKQKTQTEADKAKESLQKHQP